MLRLQSGFELDYANIYNESCIQERDVNNFEQSYTECVASYKYFHVLPALKKAMFLKMVYLKACIVLSSFRTFQENVSNTNMLKRLYELRDYASQY